MPDKYQIILGIENSQADAAARASTKLMQAYERQCLAAAKAAQNAFNGNGHPGGTGTTQRPGNGDSVAFRKARSGVDLASKEAAAYDKIQERKLRSEEKAADRAAAAQQRDILRSAKSAEQEAARFEKLEERKRLSAEKSAARDAARAEKAVARESAQAEKAAARAAKAAEPKVDIGLHKLQIDSIKATDARLAAEEKNAAQLAAIQDKFYLKDYQAKVKAEKKKEAIDDLARSRTQKAIKDLEGMEESYRVRDYKARVAQEKRKEALEGGPAANAAKFRRKALDDEQAHAVAVNRITDVQNKRKIEGIAKVMGEQRLSFAEAINSALGLDAAFTKAGVAFAAIGAGKQIFSAVVGAMNDARRASEQMAREVLDTAGALREIALIRGKFAPDEEEVRAHIGLRKATGLTQAEAVDYQTELLNQLGTISPRKFDEEQRRQLSVEGGKFAARGGGGVEAIHSRARMLGLLPDFVKAGPGGKVSAADVMAMADAVDILNQMGAASNAVSTSQAAKLITGLTTEDLKGTFHDPRKAVALSTIASKFEPEASATAALEAIRQGRGFTKFRKIKGTDAAQAETLKAAGIQEQMDPAETMVKLFEYAQKTMKPEEAFDAFLARKGFRDQTGNLRLAQFYNEFRKGNFQRIMAKAEEPLDVNAPAAKARAFAQSDVGRDLMTKAAIDAARHTQGELGKEHQLRVQQAEAQYIEQGAETSTLGGLAEYAVGLGDKERGRQALLSRRAVQAARADVGLKPGTGLGFLGTAAALSYGAFFGPQVGQAAGSIVGYQSGENVTMVRELHDIAESNRKIAETNAAMAKQEAARRAAQAPPAQPVKGPAQLSDR